MKTIYINNHTGQLVSENYPNVTAYVPKEEYDKLLERFNAMTRKAESANQQSHEETSYETTKESSRI